MRCNHNIVLIGMPGAGKSTVGVLLAKRLGLGFLDTDLYLQTREGRRLQTIIAREGIDGFRAVEERHVLQIRRRSHVIATDGSVVYCERAMRHLQAAGTIVFLDVSPAALASRLSDLETRGVIRAPGQSLDRLHAERHPLYVRWSDVRVDCSTLTPDQATERIRRGLQGVCGTAVGTASEP